MSELKVGDVVSYFGAKRTIVHISKDSYKYQTWDEDDVRTEVVIQGDTSQGLTVVFETDLKLWPEEPLKVGDNITCKTNPGEAERIIIALLPDRDLVVCSVLNEYGDFWVSSYDINTVERVSA